MLVSLDWLRDFVDTRTSAEALGERFLMTSSELENTIDWPARFTNIVVGRVQEVRTHPNADRLKVASVSIGDATLTIVCGAPNVAAGQRVAVALPGAQVSDRSTGQRVEITPATMRGVRSEGMLCAREELGLPPDESNGIWVLPVEAAAGTPLHKALGFAQAVLDLEITPNRPDLLSHLGLAREVAAFEGKKLKEPAIKAVRAPQHKALHVTLSATETVSHISAVRLSVAENPQSPWWLQRRLIEAGMRPVNLLVDLSNYVMLELGQPLHMYDCAKLPDASVLTLEAATAKKKTDISLLDGTTRTAEAGDLIILANSQPAGLAGIMGGSESAITSETREVVVEAATFDGPTIRRTSRRLGLRTEASGRFEKGLDPHLPEKALGRVLKLLEDMRVAVTVIAHDSVHAPGKRRHPEVAFNVEQFESIIGLHLGVSHAKRILQALGFSITKTSKSGLTCIPPTWRNDVRLDEDVMEELIRIWGYERVPHTLPKGEIKSPVANPAFYQTRQIRERLALLGYQETVHLSFTHERDLSLLGVTNGLPLANPLSTEQTHLLPNHLIPFLTTVSAYQHHRTARLFEIGSLFSTSHQEVRTVSGLLREEEGAEQLLRQAKTALSCIAPEVAYRTPQKPSPYYEQGTVQEVLLNAKVVGELGVVKQSIVQAKKIRRGRTLVFWNIALNPLLHPAVIPVRYNPKPAFPGSERDETIELRESTSWNDIVAALSHPPKLLKHWELIDIYRDPNQPEKKSLTLRFRYQSAEKTVTEDEVVSAHKKVVAALSRLKS